MGVSREKHRCEMLTLTIWTTRWLRVLGCNRTASRCSGSPLKSDINKCKILVAIKAVLHDFAFQWYKKPPASVSVPVSLQPKKRTWSAIKQVSVFRKLPKVDQLLLQECSHEIIHSVALWHQILHRLNKTRYSMITQRFRASLKELCYAWMYSGLLLPPIFFCLISSPVQHSYMRVVSISSSKPLPRKQK